jgi:hypothetical protein
LPIYVNLTATKELSDGFASTTAQSLSIGARKTDLHPLFDHSIARYRNADLTKGQKYQILARE